MKILLAIVVIGLIFSPLAKPQKATKPVKATLVNPISPISPISPF